MKIRSFLAFDVPSEVQQNLAQTIDLMATKVSGVRWIPPNQMHCTVKFFGEVEEAVLLGSLTKLMIQETKQCPPVKLHVQGISVFPNWRYPRVVWAGLIGDFSPLVELHEALEKKSIPFGIASDARAFRLHLTLGRTNAAMKDPNALMSFIEKQVNFDFGEMLIDRLTLFKSVLTPNGSVYSALHQFRLEGVSS